MSATECPASGASPRPDWAQVSEHAEQRLLEQLQRGDAVLLISRHDGTRVPAVVTTPPRGASIHARLAGAPIGTPLWLHHWHVTLPPATPTAKEAWR